jgi:hypothetical protein
MDDMLHFNFSVEWPALFQAPYLWGSVLRIWYSYSAKVASSKHHVPQNQSFAVEPDTAATAQKSGHVTIRKEH